MNKRGSLIYLLLPLAQAILLAGMLPGVMQDVAHASVYEANAVDGSAAGPGWMRTDQSFKTGGPDLVCRFSGTPGVGPNSHFYSIDPGECASANSDPGWRFEGYAFSAHRPDADGMCPLGTHAVKRVFNGRFAYNDTNHRFVTSDPLYDEMLGQGWEGEGVALCAPE